MMFKIFSAVILLFVAGLAGLIAYDMSKMDAETIILCSLDEGGIRIPSKLCEYYLLNYRDHKKDVNELASGAGLSFILTADNEEKYKIADSFIAYGLGVDGINHYGKYNLTPLHSAVLSNDVEMVKFLLIKGASLDIKPPSINMTPLEFAESLQKKEPSVDRSQIIQILSTKT